MTTAPSNSRVSVDTAVAQLVATARLQGEADTYPAKRRWIRYTIGLQLDVTTDRNDPSASWPVITHNISGGGVGFWSKHRIPLGTSVWVREWTRQRSGPWLAASVVHSTVGIQGHLIGVTFENATAPDSQGNRHEDADAAGDDADQEAAQAAAPAPSSFRHWSLSTKYAVIMSLVAGASVAVAHSLTHLVWPGAHPAAHILMSAVIALALAGPVVWVITHGETRFLKSLQKAIRQIGMGQVRHLSPAGAPSRELQVVCQAFLELAMTWRQREDDRHVRQQRLEELNEIKTNTLSIVSHDLRTPLTSILLYAQMLNEELESLAVEDQRRFLEIISDESNRLSRLVEDLLEAQRLESGRARWDVKAQDLTGTITGCAQAFQAIALSRSIELQVNCPDSLPPVSADSDRIAQVVNNLLSNALKYTPVGGTVWLSVQTTNREVVIRVADTGPGIPRDKWEHIFERFTQTSHPNVREMAGVGLGLYIVRQIVGRHGGAVWVDSEVGQGSEFFVSLPVKATTSPAEPAPDVVSSAGRILVCDAAPELAAMIAQTLRAEKFDVRVAYSGCRLLAQLAQGDTDVVVTDLLLPDIDAAELLDAIDALNPRSFRLVVHSHVGSGPELRRRGVDVFLQRPAAKEDLLQAIQVAMRKQSDGGNTFVLLDDGGIDLQRLSEMLLDQGHTPIIVQTISAARQQLGYYPVDAILLSEECLLPDWSKLAELKIATEYDVQLMVICKNVRKKTRRLARAHGVGLLHYRPGREEEFLAALAGSWNSRVPEFSQ